MAFDKVIDSAQLDAGMKATADAIREKTGSTDPIVWDSANGFKTAVEGIQTGGGDDGSFKAVIEGTAVNPTLPADLTKIKDYAFFDCADLALTSLPAGVTSISFQAFYDCSNLALTSLPAGMTAIYSNAFRGCIGLTEITFNGKPTSIASTAFSGCTNLLTINVPWAEDEVKNAPWGATNATINYNYTGG